MAKTFDIIKSLRDEKGLPTFKKQPNVVITPEIQERATKYVLEKDFPVNDPHWIISAVELKKVNAKVKLLLADIKSRKVSLESIGYEGDVLVNVVKKERKPRAPKAATAPAAAPKRGRKAKA